MNGVPLTISTTNVMTMSETRAMMIFLLILVPYLWIILPDIHIMEIKKASAKTDRTGENTNNKLDSSP